ncbi:MAG: HepT-like ribonuclease domain-containing protein [Candidatus Poribacteria bacterium]
MPEFDRARINKIVRDIYRFLNDLDKMKVESIDDLKNIEKFYAVSMVLFALINRTVDLGDEIVASLNIGMPSKYSDVFYLLRRNDYISRELTQNLILLVDTRNLLSHKYQDFDEEDIFDIMEKAQSIKEFVENMKNLVNE